jgi:hypothetical protein
LVTIRLSGTPAGGSHPAHIHENNVATSGNIIAGLNPVDGTTGISKTQVSALVVLQLLHTALTRNAYINVHLNDGAGLNTIVAQGNIIKRRRYRSKTQCKRLMVLILCFNGEGLTN